MFELGMMKSDSDHGVCMIRPCSCSSERERVMADNCTESVLLNDSLSKVDQPTEDEKPIEKDLEPEVGSSAAEQSPEKSFDFMISEGCSVMDVRLCFG